jgi:hypothetical protein
VRFPSLPLSDFHDWLVYTRRAVKLWEHLSSVGFHGVLKPWADLILVLLEVVTMIW